MAEAGGLCVICNETPQNQCSRLNACTHLVCMECAMKIATFEGGARCPLCRVVFETITQYDGNYSMDLQTNTLSCRGEDNTMMPFLVLSDIEMTLASRIEVGEDLDENGILSAKFYMPQFIEGVLDLPGKVLVTHDADDGLLGRVMTRSDYARFLYDKDTYKRIVVDTVDKLQNVFGARVFPLFFLKALVIKFYMELVDLGKLQLVQVQSYPGDPTDWAHLIISMQYPPAFMARATVAAMAALVNEGWSVM